MFYQKSFVNLPIKNLLTTILLILVMVLSNFNRAIAVDIGESPARNTSDLSSNDSILFTGSSGGTLNHDLVISGTFSLSDINTNNNGVGIIVMNSATELDVGSVGSSNKMIDGVLFITNGKLVMHGNFYSKNGVDTLNNNIGDFSVYGNNSVVKFSHIGTNDKKLNTLALGVGQNIRLSGNIFVKKLNIVSGSSITISDSSTVNDLGEVKIEQSSSLTINSNSTANIIDIEQNSSLNLNSNLTTDILNTLSSDTIYVNTGKQITINGSDDTTLNASFNFGVNRSDGNGDVAAMLLTGNLIIPDQSQFSPQPQFNIDYSKARYLQINDRYNFIQSSAGSITTLGQLNLNDTSFLLFPTVEVTGDSSNNLTLTEGIDSDSTALLSSQDLAITNFILSNHGFRDIDLVRTEILKIPDQPTLEAALHSLLLPNNNALQLTSLSISNQIANIIDYHIQSIDYDNFLKFEKIADKSDKDSKKNRNLWGEVFAGNAKQGAINQQSGFNNKSSGLILGFDHMIEGDNYNHLIGGSFSYDKANVTDQIGSNQKSTINAHQLSFYNSNAKKTGVGIFNDNLIGLSYNNYNTNRAINIVSYHSQAQGKFSGTSYFAKTALGYNFKIGEKILIAPIAAIKYFGLALKDYQEESPSGLGLKVKNSRFKLVTLDIGGRIIGQITPKIYSKFTLSLSHNLNKNNSQQTTSFADGTLEIENRANNIDGNYLNLGTEINFKTSKNGSLMVKYQLQSGQKLTSQFGGFKYSVAF